MKEKTTKFVVTKEDQMTDEEIRNAIDDEIIKFRMQGGYVPSKGQG
jgi:hypothetical protein